MDRRFAIGLLGCNWSPSNLHSSLVESLARRTFLLRACYCFSFNDRNLLAAAYDQVGVHLVAYLSR